MSQKKVFGVYAAVLTPRLRDEQIDVAALRTLIAFLMERGISSFALNGATGEFCLTTPAQLRTILATVKDASQGRARMICGVGAAGTALALELATVAEQEGAEALLLPMPYFFPYAQQDLEAFCRAVAAGTLLDVLLYNLPQFTSGLYPETVRTLVTEVPNIIGIKDSSGSLDILRDLTAHGVDACRIVGNDGVFAAALIEQVCDGIVSGVACALPELILDLHAQRDSLNSAEFHSLSAHLSEFIAQLDSFPTPWGIKWIVEARGVVNASFAQPVTAHRLERARLLAEWYKEWQPTAVPRATNSLLSGLARKSRKSGR